MRGIRAWFVGAVLAAGAAGCTVILSDFEVASPSADAGADTSIGEDATPPPHVVDGGADVHVVPEGGPGTHETGAGHDEGGGPTCAATQKLCGGICVSLTDPAFGCANAVSCTPCAFDHASAKCAQGLCALDTCDTGFGDCVNGASDGCETNTSSDPAHCGSCAGACNASGGAPNCAGGTCSSIACTAPHADCDQSASNGCEIDTSSDTSHCGGCGHACGAAQGTPSCSAGKCAFACAKPFAHCTNVDADGCSVNTSKDANHCGGCGHVCGHANGTPTCTTGACTFACAANFAHCSSADSDGCETDISSDPSNCGVCGNKCGAGQRCQGAKCVCDATSCGSGCCQGNSCLGGNTISACGTGGVACGACNGLTANQCTGGDCSCNGAAACTGGKACCGSTGCVDLSTDAKNCGTCGHDCGGGACVASQCQPFALASNRNGPLDLAIDGANVYWTENTTGGVYKIAKTGGAITPLKAPDNVGNSAWFITTDGTNVYWTDRADAYIGYVSVNGGAVGKLATDAVSSQPYGITNDGDFVYWADFGSGSIWRTQIKGSHPSTIIQLGSASGTTGIGVTGAAVLWSEYAGFVYKGNHGGSTGAGTLLSTATNGGKNVDSRFLATDGTRIYWTMSDGNAVWTVPNAGGTATAISTAEAEPWGIVADSTGVYWVNKNPNGAMANTVRRAQFLNGAWVVSTIAQSQGGPSSVAVDGSAIYWTSFSGGQVMKVVR